MINLKEALKKYDIKCDGVIHVGGHNAQEYSEYKNIGLIHQVWIEANPQFYEKTNQVVSDDPNCLSLNYAVLDVEKIVKFGIANNGASSSVLPLKKHIEYYPNIRYDGYIETMTKRLDNIILEHNINLSNYGGLVVDVQGAELMVLKSLGKLIKNFKFIQSEVNIEELYEGCSLINEIDEYLEQYNFKRVITKLWDNGSVGWGDALYIKS